MKNFKSLREFEKEFKKLFKKYKTLDNDFEEFKRILSIKPTGIGKNFTIIHSSPTLKIVKARMACRALRNRSFRVTYSYFEPKNQIEFIELYFKGDKEREDFDRIREYLKKY